MKLRSALECPDGADPKFVVESGTKVVFLKMSGELAATLVCEPSATAALVTARLCERLGKPSEHAHLVHILTDGRVLDDGDKLMEDGATGAVSRTVIFASSSRLSLVPGFRGLYVGHETESGGKWKFEMALDSADFVEVEGSEHDIKGIMHWRCVEGPFDVEPTLRASESVRGTVQEDGSLQLAGYACVPKTGVIAECRYDLRLSSEGTEVSGRFKGPTECDDRFVLKRVAEEDCSKWYDERRAHIAECTHRLAEEVRQSQSQD